MDGFQVELFDRLPLAQAALKIFDHVFDAGVLNGLFEEHRGRCYQGVLTFDTLVHLVRDALVLHGGSGRRSFEAADEAGALPVAYQNAYAKLGRLPPAVSMAVLAHGSRRMEALLPAGAAVELPPSLAGLEVVAFDGKKIKNAAKRLKALRGLPGKLLGGKPLVALSLRSGLALAMEADPDGERNDVPLVPGLVQQVRRRVAHAVLWMGDRQFGCSLDLPALLCARDGDHFLLRCGKTPHFHADPHRPAREGVDAAGRRFVQEWGSVGGPKDPRRRYVRRVTLYRPGEGDDVTLLTDLLDEGLYPAADLLSACLRRWGIERMFQRVTEVFDLRKLIGSTPAAMVFQSAVCFVLYDVVQVLRAHAAADGGKAREDVSTEKLFGDARDQLKTWADLGDAALTEALLPADDDPPAVAAWLARRMTGTWRGRWLKSPAKKRRGGHPARQSPQAPRRPHLGLARTPGRQGYDPDPGKDRDSSGARLRPSRLQRHCVTLVK